MDVSAFAALSKVFQIVLVVSVLWVTLPEQFYANV